VIIFLGVTTMTVLTACDTMHKLKIEYGKENLRREKITFWEEKYHNHREKKNCERILKD
jgi:hypothetical protein